jgi:Raf kinase inhibitor-like YbhB/YbcL family protein
MRLAVAAVTLLTLTLPACGGAPVNLQSEPDEPSLTAPGASTTTAPLPPPVVSAKPAKFAVTSSAFADNKQIPVQYSCKGLNMPPPLRWENAPAGTEAFALVVDDLDAPAGLYVHWVVTGISRSTTELGGGAPSRGASVSNNTSGTAEYLGPCPPAGSGVHHYRFQVYALKKPLTLPPATPASEATQMIANAAIADARMVGLFSG